MSDRTTAGGEALLLARLRRLWQSIDPAPDDLADRALFALDLDDLDTEFELLRLTERGDALAGTRATAEPSASMVTHITFAGQSTTVMLAVGPAAVRPDQRRIDGWIAPAGACRVVAHTADGETLSTADETGRFVLADVPAGMLRLLIFLHRTAAEAAAGPPMPFVTPTVEV